MPALSDAYDYERRRPPARAAGAAAAVVSNVDDGAMHAARVGGGASIGIPDATNEKAEDVYRFFCTKAPPFYRGSELRIKDPQNSLALLLLCCRASAQYGGPASKTNERANLARVGPLRRT